VAAFVANLLFGATRQGFDAAVLGAAGSITVREVINRLARAVGVLATIKEVPPSIPSFTLSSAHAVACYNYRPPEIGALIEHYGYELCASRPGSTPSTPAECDLRGYRVGMSHSYRFARLREDQRRRKLVHRP
jgi:hypothetical protein